MHIVLTENVLLASHTQTGLSLPEPKAHDDIRMSLRFLVGFGRSHLASS
jgi:hypothetical protein